MHTYTIVEEGDISNICQFRFYEWCYYRSHQYEEGRQSFVRQLFHLLLVSIAPFCYQLPWRGPELYLIPSNDGETRWQNHNNSTIHRTGIGIYLRYRLLNPSCRYANFTHAVGTCLSLRSGYLFWIVFPHNNPKKQEAR